MLKFLTALRERIAGMLRPGPPQARSFHPIEDADTTSLSECTGGCYTLIVMDAGRMPLASVTSGSMDTIWGIETTAFASGRMTQYCVIGPDGRFVQEGPAECENPDFKKNGRVTL